MKKVKRAACYVRVSTGLQDTKAQETELKQYAQSRGWSVSRVYADKTSGAKESRPALDELMGDCRKRKIDVVLVWKFDRFARSVTHLLKALETFEAAGIEFVSLSEQIDTSSPAGKMVFTVLGAVGCLERSMIVERVKAGLAQAKRDGKVLGRPAIKTLSADEIARIKAARAKGETLRALARRFKSSLWSVHQASLGGPIMSFENIRFQTTRISRKRHLQTLWNECLQKMDFRSFQTTPRFCASYQPVFQNREHGRELPRRIKTSITGSNSI